MLTFLWRNAVQKGLFGGNRTWMTLFAVIGAAKLMRRMSGSVPETVFKGELKPGESLLISHLTTTFDDTPEP